MPMPAASAPLAKSSAKTTAPAFHPSSRNVFEAPGFPEPWAVMSTPLRRAISSALGNVPTMYATGIRSSTIARSDIRPILRHPPRPRTLEPELASLGTECPGVR